jgi:quinoprotein glucose dehydrogenase
VSTPIVIDGVLYVSTPSSRVFALDAETGKKLWVFDPQEGRSPRLFNSHRGVAYWQSADGRKKGPADLQRHRRRDASLPWTLRRAGPL